MTAVKLSEIVNALPRRLATDFAVKAVLDELVIGVVAVPMIAGAEVTLLPPATARCTAGDVDGAPFVASIPLRHGDVQLGALHLYAASARVDEATMASAQTFAEVAVAYLLVARCRLDLAKSSEQEQRSSVDGVQAVRALRSSEERKSAILASAIDAVITIDDRGRIIEFNPAAEASFGRTEEEVDGSDLALIVPPPPAMGTSWAGMGRAVPSSGVLDDRFELVGVRRDGSPFPAEVTITPVDGRGPAFFVVFVRDLTQRDADDADRRRLEGRLHQAERLESLGKLAGVVAHDFNNLLTVVLNYASFIAEGSNDPDTRCYATEIVSASERASRLTRQLTQFARREPLHTEALRLDIVIDDLHDLLDRALGERVDLVVGTCGGMPTFVGDKGQTEQLLMNLTVNARDAMPDGGTLTIETTGVEDADAGVVRLVVSDTGRGMSQDVASHAFDPFFTTKSPSEGSGFGLSTVYGIVSDAGGDIEVASSPGTGTTFTITLPACPPIEPRGDTPRVPDVIVPPGVTSRDGRTILVVEDDDAVRAIAVTMLARNGFRVLDAAGGDAALVISEAETFDLLLTDVVMPGLAGRQLVERLRDQGRAPRVLFMSGFSSNAFGDRRTLDAREAMLHKPFNEVSLLAAVWAALSADAQPTSRADT